MVANKLHINIKKCCYIHFNPHRKSRKLPDTELYTTDDSLHLKIHNSTIEQVTKTKFLGVIIDEELSWQPHIDYLTTKLKCSIGSLNRIKDYIPASLHKNLYHTLFESHLIYGISVWGGVSKTHLDKLFILQKKCTRILFGDKEAYLNKFRTCVRARSKENQTLGSEFYSREHSKPLFTKNEIMTVYNLYKYHTVLLAFKILKFRTPIALHGCFNLSYRKATLLLTPRPSINFIYQASSLWNKVRTLLGINDFSVKLGKTKSALKTLISRREKMGDQNEWSEENFDLE